MTLSVIPAIINLTIFQGASYVKNFQWLTGDPATPVDLTGCTGRMQARGYYDSGEVYLDLTTENGGITLDSLLGEIQVRVSPEQSSAIELTTLVYDIEILFAGGQIARPIKGKIFIDPEVTRS